MRKMILLGAALLTLAACQSAQNLSEGERLNWRCANDKEFSLRFAAGAAEVYAAGETHRLPRIDDGVYSNGAVTYTEAGGDTSLIGIHDGPYESCARRAGDWWFRPW